MRRRPIILMIGVVVIALMVGAFVVVQPTCCAFPTQTPAQAMTLPPEVRANLTALPRATPLSGDAANTLNALGAQVNACADYDAARRDQMLQHIAWLIAPSSIPPNLIPAFGTNLTERLLYGMATFTRNMWRATGDAPDSCLLAIGRRVNGLLVAAGGEAIAVFAGTES
ncbi:MAG: hypothetical protein SGI73_18090 [Chloroflexota bacterium]|nr:hypothetical protein [Chloroflexota bacterium]